LSYDRSTSEPPRSSVFWGTTNNTDFLRDNQNRRFWPVQIEEFNLELLIRVRDQLWAEAVHRYRAGESIRMDPKLYELAEIEQDKYRSIDGMEVRLEKYFGFNENDEPTICGRVLTEDVFKIVNARNQSEYTSVSNAMTKFGWKRSQQRIQKGRRYVYYRGDVNSRLQDIYVFAKVDDLNPTASVVNWNVTLDPTPSKSYNPRTDEIPF
jgi:predicted P-loop ATPase